MRDMIKSSSGLLDFYFIQSVIYWHSYSFTNEMALYIWNIASSLEYILYISSDFQDHLYNILRSIKYKQKVVSGEGNSEEWTYYIKSESSWF